MDLKQMRVSIQQRDQQIRYLANKATRLNFTIHMLQAALRKNQQSSAATATAAAVPLEASTVKSEISFEQYQSVCEVHDHAGLASMMPHGESSIISENF